MNPAETGTDHVKLSKLDLDKDDKHASVVNKLANLEPKAVNDAPYGDNVFDLDTVLHARESEKEMLDNCINRAGQKAEPERVWPSAAEHDDLPRSPTSEYVSEKGVMSMPIDLVSEQKVPGDDAETCTDASKPCCQSRKNADLVYTAPCHSKIKATYSSIQREKPVLGGGEGILVTDRETDKVMEGSNLGAPPARNQGRMDATFGPSHWRRHEDETEDAEESTTARGYSSDGDEDVILQEVMRENYRNSRRTMLSRVVEESESFTLREFGDAALRNDQAEAARKASTSSYGYAAAHISYRHNMLSGKVSDVHEAAEYPQWVGSKRGKGIMSSKSAPAGVATRTGAAFGLFRREKSDSSAAVAASAQAFRGGRRMPAYRRPRYAGRQKPNTITSALLWPLVKIKNSYVGCMMGLEGSADLSGLTQGSSYAIAPRYFPDSPLSKVDSVNHG